MVGKYPAGAPWRDNESKEDRGGSALSNFLGERMEHRLGQTNVPSEASRPRDYRLVFLQERAVFGIS